MVGSPGYLSREELMEWQRRIEEANRNNIFCYCRACHREWVASRPEACLCGNRSIEHITCWQFPDD